MKTTFVYFQSQKYMQVAWSIRIHAVKYQNLLPKVRSPCRTKPECANFPGLGASDWVPWRAMNAKKAIFGCVPIQNKTHHNLTWYVTGVRKCQDELTSKKHWTYLKHHMALNILTPKRLLCKVVKLHCSAPERLQRGGPKSSTVKTAADWAHLSHVISVKNTRKMEEKENLPKYLGCEGYIVVYIDVRSSWCR